MNKKIMLGAVAGVAAVGLAVSGTTYAAFQGTGDITGNELGAGTLSLASLGSTVQTSATTPSNIAPGWTSGTQLVSIKNTGSLDGSKLTVKLALTDASAADQALASQLMVGLSAWTISSGDCSTSAAAHQPAPIHQSLAWAATHYASVNAGALQSGHSICVNYSLTFANTPGVVDNSAQGGHVSYDLSAVLDQ
jgi:hypothetical protein